MKNFQRIRSKLKETSTDLQVLVSPLLLAPALARGPSKVENISHLHLFCVIGVKKIILTDL